MQKRFGQGQWNGKIVFGQVAAEVEEMVGEGGRGEGAGA
jgi:hypothetical protein